MCGKLDAISDQWGMRRNQRVHLKLINELQVYLTASKDESGQGRHKGLRSAFRYHKCQNYFLKEMKGNPPDPNHTKETQGTKS